MASRLFETSDSVESPAERCCYYMNKTVGLGPTVCLLLALRIGRGVIALCVGFLLCFAFFCALPIVAVKPRAIKHLLGGPICEKYVCNVSMLAS